jgi:hypothetical protein
LPQQTIADLSVHDIIEAAESPAKTSIRFRGWGRYAGTTDLDTVFARMLQCDRADAIERYLQIFAARPFPRFDSRVLELCEHADLQVRRRASTAVAMNRYPEIRQFAIKKLREPTYQDDAIEMLATNYERGDETAVLETIVLPEDQAQRHWVLMSLLKLIESNAESECSQAARLIYDATPCSSCRHTVVKLMSNRSVLPEGLRVECQFDVDPDTRSLVGGPTWND